MSVADGSMTLPFKPERDKVVRSKTRNSMFYHTQIRQVQEFLEPRVFLSLITIGIVNLWTLFFFFFFLLSALLLLAAELLLLLFFPQAL